MRTLSGGGGSFAVGATVGCLVVAEGAPDGRPDGANVGVSPAKARDLVSLLNATLALKRRLTSRTIQQQADGNIVLLSQDLGYQRGKEVCWIMLFMLYRHMLWRVVGSPTALPHDVSGEKGSKPFCEIVTRVSFHSAGY